MSAQSDFLDIGHDMSQLAAGGYIEFWPKEAIEEALRSLVAGFRARKLCTPAEASKFRGVAGFAAMAEWGHLGRLHLSPFKQRQYWDIPPWHLSKTMLRALDFQDLLLEVKPKRRVYVGRPSKRSLVVASDAQVEPGSWPGGGCLVYDPEEDSRWGHWLAFKAQHLALWGLSLAELQEGRQPIALCEAAMLPCALLAAPEVFRGRHVLLYVDNTSAMPAFVKGASGNPDLERIIVVFWILVFHIECTVWIEWVDSKANWADGISRLFGSDPVARELGFATRETELDTQWWNDALSSVWDSIRTHVDQALEK